MRAKIRPPRCRAVPRPRLQDQLSRIWDYGLATVTAPAGSGKTTLLAQFVASSTAPVAWYRAESAESHPALFLRYLHGALSMEIPDLPGNWSGVEEAASALETACTQRTLLVIDDLHTLRGSLAEQALEQLLRYLPDNLALLTASRLPSGMNLSGMRVAGSLLELGPDDLRFRTWEVERLFRDFYGQPIRPEELAELARRTEGWAAGLQLFHLATLGKPLDEPRRTLAALGNRSRLVKEYLARNVIDDLSSDLRNFLLDTCVLGRLSGPICDTFLGRTGSGALLSDLEARQIFTYAIDEGGGFRYHEIFRSHLESVLAEEVGQAEVQRRHGRAGILLEASGAIPEALRAYCLAGEWDAVGRLVGKEGELLAQDPSAYLELLPPAMLRNDPWLLLATARRHRAAGRWDQAADLYQKAELSFEDNTARDACRQDRQNLAGWMQPSVFPATEWSGVVRAAVARDPVGAGRQADNLSGNHKDLTKGICALLAGMVDDAAAQFERVLQSLDPSEATVAGAHLGLAVALLMGTHPRGGEEAEHACEAAEALGLPWLTRMSRAALALTDRADGLSEAAASRMACERQGDLWGASLAGLFEGLGALRAGQGRAAVLERAAADFDQLGAGCLAAWCLSTRALTLARLGEASAQHAGRSAETAALAAGAPGAAALSYLAQAETSEPLSARYAAQADAILGGLGLDRFGAATLPPETTIDSLVEVRCFGGFSMAVDGRPLDLSCVKPRVRSLLRLLALNPRPIHREVLAEALWPEADAEVSRRNLHVAISSLRKVLGDHIRPGRPIIAREGDAYRLDLGDDASVDVVEFGTLLSRGRRQLVSADVDGAIDSFRCALDRHSGDLLPEDGSLEMVARERDRFRTEAVNAAAALAGLYLEKKCPSDAVHACERGLQIERNCDELWRTLLDAHQEAGDRAAEALTIRRYKEVLKELNS